tara:strand:+ start:256 stop:954 length:699 start_codon:yes stop_codon:yes gene_type:complete
MIRQILLTLAGSVILLAALVYFTEETPSPELLVSDDVADLQGPLTREEQESSKLENPINLHNMNPIAIISTNYGVIELELFADTMPVTAGNFTKLAEEGFYNGTKFHRVISDFMVQGGDPNSKGTDESTYGTGSPGYTIQDEHVAGEMLSNVKGTIAMANSGPNTGGSQFFINLADNTYLDFDKEPLQSKHPVFGRVVSGMDVVEKIGVVETKERDIPVEPIVVEKIEIVRP